MIFSIAVLFFGISAFSSEVKIDVKKSLLGSYIKVKAKTDPLGLYPFGPNKAVALAVKKLCIEKGYPYVKTAMTDYPSGDSISITPTEDSVRKISLIEIECYKNPTKGRVSLKYNR